MRRGCLFGMLGLLGLCVVGCGLLYFLALPEVRDEAQESLRDAIGSEVAVLIPATPDAGAAPGRYVLTQQELQRSLQANLGGDGVDDIAIRISPVGLELAVSTQGDQDATYTGLPTAENGRLVMQDMESDSRFLNFIVPAGDLGEAIDEAVNDYLAVNGLRLEAVELAEGELTLETVATP